MMIKLTSSFNKQVFAVKADMILISERSTDNPLVTTVVTSLTSPKGLVSYSILESPSEVADLVSLAEGKEPVGERAPASALATAS